MCAANEQRKPRERLIDSAGLQIAYNSEVCTDDFGQPRSAFLLLRYIPSAKTFLTCRKVKSIEVAQRVIENQPTPHHDIRYMIGFSLKDFLPPRPTPAVETAVPKDNPPRKRKAVERGSSSQPEGGAKIQEIPRSSPLSGPSPPSQPLMMLLGNVLDPSAIPRDAVASESGNDLV